MPVAIERREVKAFDIAAGTLALRRRWWLVALLTIAGAAAGVLAAALVPEVWQSEINIQVGAVYGQPLEDSATVARMLESQSFRDSIPSGVRPVDGQIIEVQTVGAGTPAGVAYLRILGLGRSQREAMELASHAAKSVDSRHEGLYAEALKNHLDFDALLSRTMETTADAIERIEATLQSLPPGSRDGSIVLVALMNLETRRTQYLQTARELRDARLQRAANTKKTTVLGPPSTPLEPLWPKPAFFGVLGALVGLTAGIIGVLATGARSPHARAELAAR
jgi:hypothetical protein